MELEVNYIAFTFTQRFRLLHAGEVHHALKTSAPKVIFASANVVETLKAALSQSNLRPIVVVIGDAPALTTDEHYLAFEAFVNNRNVQTDFNNFQCNRQNQSEKVALLLSSSGTTGLPKAVQLSEQNIMYGLAHMEYEIEYPCFIYLPLFTFIYSFEN